MRDRLTTHRRLRGLLLAAGAGLVLAAGLPSAPVLAQDATCQAIGPLLEARRSIVERLNGLGSENVDPRPACRALRDLQSNGDEIVEFLEENQAWCQIPNEFATNMRQDHERVGSLRTEACKAAAQVNQLEQQARQQQESRQLGGPGLTGRFPIPQGAL